MVQYQLTTPHVCVYLVNLGQRLSIIRLLLYS